MDVENWFPLCRNVNPNMYIPRQIDIASCLRIVLYGMLYGILYCILYCIQIGLYIVYSIVYCIVYSIAYGHTMVNCIVYCIVYWLYIELYIVLYTDLYCISNCILIYIVLKPFWLNAFLRRRSTHFYIDFGTVSSARDNADERGSRFDKAWRSASIEYGYSLGCQFAVSTTFARFERCTRVIIAAGHGDAGGNWQRRGIDATVADVAAKR